MISRPIPTTTSDRTIDRELRLLDPPERVFSHAPPADLPVLDESIRRFGAGLPPG